MCRLLAVRAAEPFAIAPYLERFAEVARTSPEYQGDGWGCAFLHDGIWQLVRSVRPIWEECPGDLGTTAFLVAHARSAFDTRGPMIEHTMPFVAGPLAFAFNGELRGVRLQAEGRIGAEKLFNLVRRMANGDAGHALARATALLRERSAYVRAANVLLAEGDRLHVQTFFSEQPDYFTLHVRQHDGSTVVCSAPLADGGDWRPLPNDTREVFT
jgi:predicted glutamine amidotransferase